MLGLKPHFESVSLLRDNSKSQPLILAHVEGLEPKANCITALKK